MAMGSRGAARLAREGIKRQLRGCMLAPFNKRKELVTRHPLDTENDEYHSVLRNIVVPVCMNIASDVPEYGKRIQELLSKYNPAFDDVWNFGVELQYKMVAPPSHQNEENLTKMRLLRAAMDLAFTSSALVDDVTDESIQRKGIPAWHLVCEGGPWAGLYDGIVVGYLPFLLIRDFFSGDPGYPHMLAAIAQAHAKMLVGQTLDTLGQGKTPSSAVCQKIALYKAGHFFAAQPALGLLHAGVKDKRVIDKASEVYVDFGILPQIWDDFNDYYTKEEHCGKKCNDFKNAGNTWVSVTAFENFTPRQKEIFLKCYGSSDPEKVETVKQLYDEVNIPFHYIKYLKECYSKISTKILEIPDERVQNACFSQLEWLLGDACYDNFSIDDI